MSSAEPTAGYSLFGGRLTDWHERLDAVVAMMREMSARTDPQAMVRAYGARLRDMLPPSEYLSLSRRGLDRPRYRITRSSRWKEEINPWAQRDRLPLLAGGVLADLIYSDRPQILHDFEPDPDDPAFDYLANARSIMAIPNYDQGVALNMTVRLSDQPDTFDFETFPEHVWMSNLFGRATHNLALADELKRAYAIVDRELKIVADIQRALLPREIPQIPTLGLAAHYQTSQWAGGDYYDFFPLGNGRWGILIADVSGHGTPAAVMMAITHGLAHSHPERADPPSALLAHVNARLADRYTNEGEAFVTAFYGVYDPARRTLTYASAGHNPPRLKRCEDGSVASLDAVGNLPLGVFADGRFDEHTVELIPGDQIVFYTDGITEATNAEGVMFGLERLDEVLENCHLTADGLIHEVLDALDRFTAGAPPADDRTLLVAKVS